MSKYSAKYKEQLSEEDKLFVKELDKKYNLTSYISREEGEKLARIGMVGEDLSLELSGLTAREFPYDEFVVMSPSRPSRDDSHRFWARLICGYYPESIGDRNTGRPICLHGIIVLDPKNKKIWDQCDLSKNCLDY